MTGAYAKAGVDYRRLQPFKDKIKWLTVGYGEKGWWTFDVELK